jgi:hypothetical protein
LKNICSIQTKSYFSKTIDKHIQTMTTDLKKAYSKKLELLRPNLTGPDKTEACQELNISRPTIDKYLSGNVAKIDIADKIIKFLSERVNQRIKDLRETNVA